MTTSFACAFIERFKSQPFFFYLAYRAPHVPLDAPKKYTDRFPGEMPENRRLTLGMIAAVDDGVGRVMETLRKNGLEENTLIFVIADNGAPIGLTTPEMRAKGSPDWPGSLNDPLNGGKGMLIEGGIRTPWVVHWKGTIPGGQVYANPVITLDVAATANALAGQPSDSALDGVNLMPYLTGKDAGKPHEVLFWKWETQAAIRKGDWKYLTNGAREYLFNLSTDLEEKHDLLANNPELAKSLRAELEKWSQTLNPPGLSKTAGRAEAPFKFYLDGEHNITKKKHSEEGGGRKAKRKAPNADDGGDE